jgi:aryl-alcohol dehydrogenase-like predicted oxidoreductase
MEQRTLGKTGLQVSRLGVGLAEIGGLTFEEEQQAGQVLNTALDQGITFLDTAACYGNSEALIGRTVAHRRADFVLASKCGHVTGGYEGEAWTAQTVRDSIDRSLVRMKTDVIDLMQLHSCGVDVLEKGEVIEALQKAQQAGKVRFIGYSGDNESAAWAVESGLFATLQTSFNLVDQHARTKLFAKVKEQGMGLINKRPIANGTWGAQASPSDYAAEYFRRAQIMQQAGELPEAPENRIWLALGFTLAHDAVDTAIVGTRNPAHMQSNIDWLNSLPPLAAQAVDELHRRFEAQDDGWIQKG